MRFLANENFPFPAILALRNNGFFVKSIFEDSPGISDKKVVSIAQKEDFVILTFDKDYGELIFRYSIEKPPAVVFFRYKGTDPIFAGSFLLSLIENGLILEHHFTVVEKENVRQRPY